VTTLPRSVKDASALQQRLEAVRGRIDRAARQAGRDPASVTLVGVVKTVPPERVREAVRLGLADLGENRVQEAEGKIAAVGRAGLRWHMIGHLQRNKAARAVELFDRIHSVDSIELARALARRAQSAGRSLPVLVEVNVGGEPTKFGVAPGALGALLEGVAARPGLALEGLMTVGPEAAEPEQVRPVFAALRELRGRWESSLGLRLPQLSMGMSGDFEVAIEEGSTMVRVGSAIFGPRA
jgi:pyridoxal phosphate enzyme (YggS family)